MSRLLLISQQQKSKASDSYICCAFASWLRLGTTTVCGPQDWVRENVAMLRVLDNDIQENRAKVATLPKDTRVDHLYRGVGVAATRREWQGRANGTSGHRHGALWL